MILFDDKTMERFENQITLETLDHLIINAKKRQDKSFILSALTKLWKPRIVVRFTIWYHMYNLKNVKNTHRGVLVLVKLQAEVCNFTKINTPPWVFFMVFKLYKWYQIAQRITIK